MSRIISGARNFITTLYLVQGNCEKATPHLEWLTDHTDDDESVARYTDLLKECEARAAQFRPDPATALDDDAVLAEVETQLEGVGVTPLGALC